MMEACRVSKDVDRQTRHVEDACEWMRRGWEQEKSSLFPHVVGSDEGDVTDLGVHCDVGGMSVLRFPFRRLNGRRRDAMLVGARS